MGSSIFHMRRFGGSQLLCYHSAWTFGQTVERPTGKELQLTNKQGRLEAGSSAPVKHQMTVAPGDSLKVTSGETMSQNQPTKMLVDS